MFLNFERLFEVMNTKTITHKIVFPATPAEVYAVFTNAKIHSAATGGQATGGAKVGAAFTAWDGYISGKVIELVPSKKVVQEWKTTEWEEGFAPSRLELRFLGCPKGCEIIMVHSGLPSASASSYNSGWKEFYWTPMKEYFLNKAKKK